MGSTQPCAPQPPPNSQFCVQMSLIIALPPEGQAGAGGNHEAVEEKALSAGFVSRSEPLTSVLPRRLCPPGGSNQCLIQLRSLCPCRSPRGRADAELLYLLAAL